MIVPGVERATSRGLTFIRGAQAPDGGFASYSSPTLQPFVSKLTYQTTFTPALILSAISKLTDVDALTVRQSLAKWLISQKSPAWSFNYWAISAPERHSQPYPNDLDDTFCALIALHQHQPSLIDEACLGRVVKLLVATESQVGGPYRTWLVPKDAPAVWQDVDLAVNSNIACFLSLVAEPLPNLIALIEQAITKLAFRSPYYPSPFAIIYYIARWYRGKHGSKLVRFLLDNQKNGSWGNALQTALAVSSLVRLGQAKQCKTTVEQLVDQQSADGSWPASAFCLDPAIKGRAYYSGASALTTALVLEALHEYHQALAAQPRTAIVKADQSKVQTHRKQITTAALDTCDSLSTELRQETRTMLQKVLTRTDSDEILLLPHHFNGSLTSPLDAKKADLLLQLGLANLFGWTAYTIYDDFLDDEGQPRLLSVANVCLRYSLQHFAKIAPSRASFQSFVRQTFDSIDGANAWELAHCRAQITDKTITIAKLPRYATTLQLADRSLGHTLTPLGVLAATGIEPDDKRAVLVQLALRQYIAARQLNDDLHDWEQDVRAGRISYVVAKILQELNTAPGKYPLASLLPKMQRQFWHHTLPTICGIITKHTGKARRAAAASRLLQPSNIITTLTHSIDQSVEETIQEQAKAETFLAAYKQ